MKTIENRVVAAVSKSLLVEASTITPAASFSGDLHADSLDMVEMIMLLEEEFEIEIPDEDAERIRTVQELIDYVLNAPRAKSDSL